jgi:hypothetical protein
LFSWLGYREREVEDPGAGAATDLLDEHTRKELTVLQVQLDERKQSISDLDVELGAEESAASSRRITKTSADERIFRAREPVQWVQLSVKRERTVLVLSCTANLEGGMDVVIPSLAERS